MSLAVRCDNLSKRYRVARAGTRAAFGYRTLRDDLMKAFTLLRWARGEETTTDFWALRDVSFEVRTGEVLGVIGRNGAGKSTLLKVLSRITKPSGGQVELFGRVGSLLEVGTGFHPELTGRENIYLNGSVLGMRRHEINARFDRIVEFAEIGPFLDTPVKRYSSGMYVRLAFAVAAHLEPEVLIVDEVLAVGDMALQKKCMGRMREVGRTGCTVLFVSHNMPAIESLCTRAILLDAGQVALDGPVPELVREYHRRMLGAAGDSCDVLAQEAGRPSPVFRSVTLLDEQGEATNFLQLGSAFRLRIGLAPARRIDSPIITIGIDDTLGQRVLSLVTPLSRPVLEQITGPCQLECVVPSFPLAPGDYWVKLGVATSGEEIDDVERVLFFTVTNADAFGEGRGFHRGLCIAPSRWAVL